MGRPGRGTIEATAKAEADWVEQVNEVAHRTLFVKANSWSMGADVPGKARLFMPCVSGFMNYRRRCEEIAPAGYPGFMVVGPATRASA